MTPPGFRRASAFVLFTLRFRAAPAGPLRFLQRAAALFLLACPAPAWSDTAGLEDAIKATYLCKLPAFVTWPGSAPDAGAFILCVVGQSPFGAMLDRAAEGQTVRQRPIVVRRYATVAGRADCQVMFVAGSDAQGVAAVLALVRGAPVLTVTDGQTASDSTGIVNFVLADGHVRFEIDDRMAAGSGLVISSKLLSLATLVRGRAVQ
jgi:prepilin-type processing-associated H-X9-DG protein